MAAVQERLLAADARLLTLTGPGGTGKTRLALQVAAELLDNFEDGVVFVNLAPIGEAGLVASTIAQALDLRAAGGRPITEVMKDYLRARQLLLVLDNFEQVLPAAPLIAELLGDCPRLKVLVTSRALLHLRGEQDVPVPPLTLPEPGHQPTPESLSRSAAVTLFIQRAREARPDFAVTTENAPALAEICVRLDGLPLAIELAAARVRLLPPRTLLTRLARRLPLLTGGARDLPARQQTLRDTIAWSYDLLAPVERALLDRLGVFVGGWTLEAAGAVAEEDAFDGLATLVDQSLVQPGELSDGEPRFTMLETVREFALERLEATGELTETRRRHAAYYLALAEQAEPELFRQAQPEWLDRLAAELENVRAALAWYQATPGEAGHESGLRLAAALERFWWVRGLWAEAGNWLLQGLAASSGAPSLTRLRALNVAAMLSVNQADFGLASRLADEALLLARQTGDDLQAGHALITLGNVARNQSEHGRDIQFYEQALPLLERAGDPDGLARVFTTLGQALRAQGNQERAVQCQERSLTFWRRLRAWVGLHWSVGDLGRLALARGDTERAAALCAESLVLSRDSGDRLQLARALEGLAGVAATTGRPGRAARLLGAADALRLAIKGPLWPSERASYDRHLAATRAALGEAAFAAAWAAGRALTLEQAIASALEESASD